MKPPLRNQIQINRDHLLDQIFYCPACTAWRKSIYLNPLQKQLHRRTVTRSASTLTSATAINATKDLPPRYKPLYQALEDVKRKASAYVNLSRLQLAIQGLESATPVTRVAVLGLDVQNIARRIVRLLLADALEQEGKWERDLRAIEANFDQGLIIRYGHPPNSSIPRLATSVPVLHIPSSVLERNNIEILISSINAPKIGDQLQSGQTIPSDSILSPMIGTPTDANGRFTVISQPVHGCLIVGSGFDELVKIAELLASTKFTSSQDRQSVSVGIDLPDHTSNENGTILIFDASKAEAGLASIRRSLGEATTYEHKWVESGMPLVSRWLTLSSASKSTEKPPKPIHNLISSLLATARLNLKAQVGVVFSNNGAKSVGSASRAHLSSAIDNFSRNAHLELQSGLASAWSSRNWRKLAWYKLFWRVDDVSLIITDLISNAWLPNTERAVYEISGRLSQAGITPIDRPSQQQMEANTSIGVELKTTDVDIQPQPSILQNQFTTGGPPITEPVIVNPTGTANLAMQSKLQPVPLSLSISTHRNQKIAEAIANLTSTAQQIVLRTLTITGFSSGLSVLTYLTLTPGNFYEAGTIVALGTTFALWRMQRSWLSATRALEDGLFDEGRSVVNHVVQRMRDLVNQNEQEEARAAASSIESRARQEAEVAVEQAIQELDKLTSTK